MADHRHTEEEIPYGQLPSTHYGKFELVFVMISLERLGRATQRYVSSALLLLPTAHLLYWPAPPQTTPDTERGVVVRQRRRQERRVRRDTVLADPHVLCELA